MPRKRLQHVTVTCYNKTKVYPSAKAAEKFFWDCADNSEGAERERYMNILSQLRKGMIVCDDQQRY